MTHTPHHLLLTGGAGFIGSNLVRFLLDNQPDCQIINLDSLTYAGSRDNLKDLSAPQRHRLVEGDICDSALVDRLFTEYPIDTVIHCAAESHVDRSISGPAAFIQTNLVGTFTLLEAARRHWLGNGCSEGVRFHHISTDEVYGTLGPDDPPFHETTAYRPNSPYSASKAGSDHLVRAYFHTYGLPVTTSNCSNNYGPFQHQEKFIPTVIRACLRQEPIPVYGDGSNIRDWLYVEDHCRGIHAVLSRGSLGETYNLGGDNEWPNIEIVRTICGLFDERFPQNAPHHRLISFVTDRPGHDWRYAIDASQARETLDWRPREDFHSGIRKTVDWYLSAREG